MSTGKRQRNMKIGKVEIQEGALMAPLAGFTDVGMRALVRELGASLTYTEMVSAKGLCYNSEKTRELLQIYPTEKPVAAQIFGGEPEFIGKALHDESLAPFDIIDINMGCPVPKIVKNGEGSALLKDIDRAKRVVETAVENSNGRPITVKMRIGFHNGEDIAVKFATALEESGASAITVHGRTREQYYTGEADWNVIAEVVKACHIPIIANGDVVDKASYDEILKVTNAAGVMIGRGALGNAGIFSEILGKKPSMTHREMLLFEIGVLEKYQNERYIYNTMKKNVCYYTKGMRNSKSIKAEVGRIDSLKELYDIVNKYFD